MAVVDRLGHARAIAMFGLDRLRKPHIGGAHLLLQRMTTAGEIGFDPLDARFLLRRQVELAVKQRMQFGLARPWRLRDHTPDEHAGDGGRDGDRSEEHTSELQSLMRISYAVFCLKKKTH